MQQNSVRQYERSRLDETNSRSAFVDECGLRRRLSDSASLVDEHRDRLACASGVVPNEKITWG